MKNSRLVEIFGWYGTVAIILAYALTSYSVVQPNSVAYQLLNLTGATGVVFASWKRKAYQPVTINIFWAVIALIAIIRLIR